MMNDAEKNGCAAIVVIAVLLVACFVLGLHVQRWAVRREATTHGVAEWRIDPMTGEESFVWLTESEGE